MDAEKCANDEPYEPKNHSRFTCIICNELHCILQMVDKLECIHKICKQCKEKEINRNASIRINCSICNVKNKLENSDTLKSSRLSTKLSDATHSESRSRFGDSYLSTDRSRKYSSTLSNTSEEREQHTASVCASKACLRHHGDSSTAECEMKRRAVIRASRILKTFIEVNLQKKNCEIPKLYNMIDSTHKRLQSLVTKFTTQLDNSTQKLMKTIKEGSQRSNDSVVEFHTNLANNLLEMNNFIGKTFIELSETLRHTTNSSKLLFLVYKDLLTLNVELMLPIGRELRILASLDNQTQPVNCQQKINTQVAPSITLNKFTLNLSADEKTQILRSAKASNDVCAPKFIQFMTRNSSMDHNETSVLLNKHHASNNRIASRKMIYKYRFGCHGPYDGQFAEPTGVAITANNDIAVADTNNHRIQVFTDRGDFRYKFGSYGLHKGEFLYPNRIAVNRNSGEFVITERHPTNQVQIFDESGQFIRKFGAGILKKPRGVYVDSRGRIIVIESKVMNVTIFDRWGILIRKFDCSQHLKFPTGVCANYNNEILISDNYAHCVKVFSYDGKLIRQIGDELTTRFPIGVSMNPLGEVIIADNHQSFNLNAFDVSGRYLYALQSNERHVQCYDYALIRDDTLVLASKDHRLYIYPYRNFI